MDGIEKYFVPECEDGCLTWEEHVEKYPDLEPRGADLLHIVSDPMAMSGDAMVVIHTR